MPWPAGAGETAASPTRPQWPEFSLELTKPPDASERGRVSKAFVSAGVAHARRRGGIQSASFAFSSMLKEKKPLGASSIYGRNGKSLKRVSFQGDAAGEPARCRRRDDNAPRGRPP